MHAPDRSQDDEETTSPSNAGYPHGIAGWSRRLADGRVTVVTNVPALRRGCQLRRLVRGVTVLRVPDAPRRRREGGAVLRFLYQGPGQTCVLPDGNRT